MNNGGCEVLLELKGVHASYGLVKALCGASLHVREGEIVALLGANGAGKTTTLRAICGILPSSQGEVLFQGRSLRGIAPERVVGLGIACVDERRLLFPSLSVMDNLALGAYRRRRDRREEIEADLEAVFQLFPILRERKGQATGTLSGGEQQMLAIGRALMSRPRLLMLDEPSLGLAPLLVREAMRTITKLKTQGVTILLVEQNARAALEIADRGYVMEQGRVVFEGSSAELMVEERITTAYLKTKKRGTNRDKIN